MKAYTRRIRAAREDVDTIDEDIEVISDEDILSDGAPVHLEDDRTSPMRRPYQAPSRGLCVSAGCPRASGDRCCLLGHLHDDEARP